MSKERSGFFSVLMWTCVGAISIVGKLRNQRLLVMISSEPEDAGFEYSEEDALGAHFVSMQQVFRE